MELVTGMSREVVPDEDVYVADRDTYWRSLCSPFGLARSREDKETSFCSSLSVPYVSKWAQRARGLMLECCRKCGSTKKHCTVVV
jgi:hypothetical protein